MPRRVAFSGKQKRAQLHERNLRKAEKGKSEVLLKYQTKKKRKKETYDKLSLFLANTLDLSSFDYLQKDVALDPGIALTEEFLPNVVRNSRLDSHRYVNEEQK